MTDQFVERRADPPALDGWHLDKKVPLSLIFAMLAQAAMVIVAMTDIKKDVEVLKSEVVGLVQRDTAIETRNTEAHRMLQDQFTRIDQKLDRLIDRSK